MFIQRKNLSISKPEWLAKSVHEDMLCWACLSSDIGLKLANQEALGLEVILYLAHSVLSTVELDNVRGCQPVPLDAPRVS
jgi:hypothetical protein